MSRRFKNGQKRIKETKEMISSDQQATRSNTLDMVGWTLLGHSQFAWPMQIVYPPERISMGIRLDQINRLALEIHLKFSGGKTIECDIYSICQVDSPAWDNTETNYDIMKATLRVERTGFTALHGRQWYTPLVNIMQPLLQCTLRLGLWRQHRRGPSNTSFIA